MKIAVKTTEAFQENVLYEAAIPKDKKAKFFLTI